MGLLDLIRNRKKPVEKPIETIVVPEQSASKLNLSKKIEMNFTKLNLDKEDVRSKRIFLLDVSGSMLEIVEKQPKITSLRDVMSNYSDARMVAFASDVRDVEKASDIPKPGGGTDLMLALIHISKLKELPERIVLVSDGEPDDESYALREAEILKIPIDIIFIGKEGSRGDKFMKRLAETTGGQNFTIN